MCYLVIVSVVVDVVSEDDDEVTVDTRGLTRESIIVLGIPLPAI